jgi:hypothetical protein
VPRGGKRPARPKSRTRNMQSHEDGSGGHRPTGRGAKGADARSLEEEGRRPGRPDVGSAGTELRDASTRRGESPGFTRLPRRWTLTTQLFTREPNRVLWPRATLRLLQGTRQPVLWPGATLRLFTLLKRPTTTTQNHKGAANLGIFSPAKVQDQFPSEEPNWATVPGGRASVPPSWVTNVEGLGHKVRTQVCHSECVARSIPS